MKNNKKINYILFTIQQLTAVLAFIFVAEIMLNSFITIKTLQGQKTYSLNAFGTEKKFEDSDLFSNIFYDSVSDVFRLVVIKQQMETNGKFNPNKVIDVSNYVNRKTEGLSSAVTAKYKLEDLIKWGRYGLEYTDCYMSISEFVNYFGEFRYWDNFAYDEYGQLYFCGYNVSDAANIKGNNITIENSDSSEIQEDIIEGDYTDDELEDMVFTYLINNLSDKIDVVQDESGKTMIQFYMVKPKYQTYDGKSSIQSMVSNWIEYFELEENITKSVDEITTNYIQYQTGEELYDENNGNIKYAVMIPGQNGDVLYTNVKDLNGDQISDITDYFAEFRKYVIYYPDSMEFIGNSNITEDNLLNFLSLYSYAFPEDSHIWIGVDTTYSVQNDNISLASRCFNKIVPQIVKFSSLVALCAAIWITLGVCIVFLIDKADEEAEQLKLKHFDRIWTELELLLFFFTLELMYGGMAVLKALAQNSLSVGMIFDSMLSLPFYKYLCFALYGLVSSVLVTSFVYSFVRRLFAHNLFENSFLKVLLKTANRIMTFSMEHENQTIETILEYVIFLIINIAGLILIFVKKSNLVLIILIALVVVSIDVWVGLLLVKNSLEKKDIISGINRIRDGEVDYELNTDKLHGTNKKLAQSVNKIGEGIRKAVKISVKDEQLKTDLITNVSHDLKTPLTSIVSYVDLLKKEKIDNSNVTKYVDIIDKKTRRLKQLTDDLVEVSKISSGNIVLEKTNINMTVLLNQAIGEFSDKFEENNLKVIMSAKSPQTMIYADSRRMWRVIENLFNNTCKYAAQNTRVYIDEDVIDGFEEIQIKNISAMQLNIKPEELTERFIRGDESRTTEGSGLGLSIAKNLVTVQGGEFELFFDGDLFKVVMRFHSVNE